MGICRARDLTCELIKLSWRFSTYKGTYVVNSSGRGGSSCLIIGVLKLFIIFSNYYGLLFLNVEIFILYVSDVAGVGSRCIVILMMLYYFLFSVTALSIGIIRGLIRGCTFTLVHFGLVESFTVVYPGVLGIVSDYHT